MKTPSRIVQNMTLRVIGSRSIPTPLSDALLGESCRKLRILLPWLAYETFQLPSGPGALRRTGERAGGSRTDLARSLDRRLHSSARDDRSRGSPPDRASPRGQGAEIRLVER